MGEEMGYVGGGGLCGRRWVMGRRWGVPGSQYCMAMVIIRRVLHSKHAPWRSTLWGFADLYTTSFTKRCSKRMPTIACINKLLGPFRASG